ncbi:MAG: NUDIX hydrolase [Bacteroidales bacterium]|nr:NUDIX hydrolase [Bacteroidales bacterium]
MPYTYEYPRPALTVDGFVLRKTGAHTELLLIERKHWPFQGSWALPGGFVNEQETLEQAVDREIFEETGLKNLSFKQFHTYGHPDRDPRHRTVTVVYVAWITENQPITAGDDAAGAAWFNITALPPLAFDHAAILYEVITALNLKTD